MVDLSFTAAADTHATRASAISESRATRFVLLALALAFDADFQLLPLVQGFAEAIKRGLETFDL